MYVQNPNGYVGPELARTKQAYIRTRIRRATVNPGSMAAWHRQSHGHTPRNATATVSAPTESNGFPESELK